VTGAQPREPTDPPRAPVTARWASSAFDLVAALGPMTSLAISAAAVRESRDMGTFIVMVLLLAGVCGAFGVIWSAQVGSCSSRQQTLGMRAWRLRAEGGRLVFFLSPPAWMALAGAALFLTFVQHVNDEPEEALSVAAAIVGSLALAFALLDWGALFLTRRSLVERIFGIDTRLVALPPLDAGNARPAPSHRRALAGLIDACAFHGPLVPPIGLLILLQHATLPAGAAFAFAGACSACVAFTSFRCFADAGHSVGLAAMSLRAVPAEGNLRAAATTRLVVSLLADAAAGLVLAFGLHGSDGHVMMICGLAAAPFALNALSALGGRTWVDGLAGIRVVDARQPESPEAAGPYRTSSA
jgi:hypothetical protein